MNGNISPMDFVVFDLETTGLSIYTSEIIEIAAVRVRGLEMEDCFSMLVKPTQPIPSTITNLTGISNADVQNAPDISSVINDFIAFIGNDTLMGHNISHYDIPFLKRILSENGMQLHNSIEDTFLIAQKKLPQLESKTLEALCQYYNIVNKDAHRALSDCMATLDVYKCLINDIEGDASNIKKSVRQTFRKPFSEQTQSLLQLKGILEGITCDDVLSESEVLYLNKWLDQNRELKGNFPFDVVFEEVGTALADGVLEQHELDRMLAVFKELLDPVEFKSEKTDIIIMKGKTICLTGEFVTDTRENMRAYFTERGAIVKDNVVKNTDYVIVGGNGSDAWACGNYGSKVKKALELQAKGHNVKILRESEALKGIHGTADI